MNFISPTRGEMSLNTMFQDILAFVAADPEAGYKLIIGSDSHTRDDLCFVTAVVIHRVGKGARYYYQRHHQRRMYSLRQRIYHEASRSLEVASRLAELLSANGSDLNVEIHLDIGQSGETRELIREIVGMVVGSGFDAKIKPESYGASKVADKHSK
ncbi:MAG: ribonuclease H-like YkuK family protein [Thermaerobacter sp.]|jgi:predicted RNase H-related nuclease YkuK (DUF458 family)|nr:ribonuclease H-like YkuK family protein [Thermaerobacter sp.]MDA8146232.1 ribonuclease H-like YkuK family protein [Thermaerobacter sp.]